MSSTLARIARAQQRIAAERAKVRFWYVLGYWPATKQWGGWVGPLRLTDYQLYRKIKDEQARSRGLTHYRLAYSPLQRVWLQDNRTETELAESLAPIPGYDSDPWISGTTVGAIRVSPPLSGVWPFVGHPPRVQISKMHFDRSGWTFPRRGVVAQYRERVPVNSKHLFVLENGRFVVPHMDEENPDLGSAIGHFVKDVMKRPDPMTPLEAFLRVKAPAL